MNILLINNNPIVSNLFALSAKSIVNLHIDEIDNRGLIPKNSYDILFIDDECCDQVQLEEFFAMIQANKKVLFSNKYKSKIERVDTVIRKPFLPSQIIEMLQRDNENQESLPDEIEALLHYENKAEDGNNESKKSMVLDSNEIDTIKKLLLDNEEPIREEQKSKDSQDTLIENVIDLVGDMKPKMLKKILAGAQIKIKIKFPKEV